MNTNNKYFRYIKFAGVTTVCAFLTAAYICSLPQKHEVTITAPFKVERINLKTNEIKLLTTDEKYSLDFQFNGVFYKDGNGFQNWNEIDIQNIGEIKVYDENGLVENPNISQETIQDIISLVKSTVNERI